MKAFLVAYDGRELHKNVRAKNNKIWACHAVQKASNPNWVAQNFRG
jgi:hypothetical protein